MRVLIADSDPASRRWIRRILRESLQYQIVGEVTDGARTVESARQARPDAVVLSHTFTSEDPALPTRLISHAEAAVIMVTVTGAAAAVWRGILSGASGYLLKDRLASELQPALAAAESGGTFVSPPLIRQLVGYLGDRFEASHDGPNATEIVQRLLPRERETLYRLADGRSTEEIAVDMSVATATVRAYVSRVLRKLNLRSRGEAIALAYRSGFYRPGHRRMSGAAGPGPRPSVLLTGSLRTLGTDLEPIR